MENFHRFGARFTSFLFKNRLSRESKVGKIVPLSPMFVGISNWIPRGAAQDRKFPWKFLEPRIAQGVLISKRISRNLCQGQGTGTGTGTGMIHVSPRQLTQSCPPSLVGGERMHV